MSVNHSATAEHECSSRVRARESFYMFMSFQQRLAVATTLTMYGSTHYNSAATESSVKLVFRVVNAERLATPDQSSRSL